MHKKVTAAKMKGKFVKSDSGLRILVLTNEWVNATISKILIAINIGISFF